MDGGTGGAVINRAVLEGAGRVGDNCELPRDSRGSSEVPETARIDREFNKGLERALEVRLSLLRTDGSRMVTGGLGMKLGDPEGTGADGDGVRTLLRLLEANDGLDPDVGEGRDGKGGWAETESIWGSPEA